jgi:hypothetical protein
MSHHCLDDLVSQRWDARVADCNHIEGLEVVHKVQHATFLFHTEPVRPIWGIGVLVYTGHKLVLEYLYDLIEDAGWDGDVAVSPRNMLDNGNFYWWEVVISEMTLLVLCPCKSEFIEFEDVVQQFELLWVEEVISIELEVLKPL